MAQMVKTWVCLGQRSLQRTYLGLKVTQNIQFSEKLRTSVISPSVAIFSSRHYGSLVDKDADGLWASVQGVSRQGQRTGRAKGKRLRPFPKQGLMKVGTGKSGVQFPGLHKGISDSLKITVGQAAHEEDFPMKKKKRFQKILPLERGYTGGKKAGTVEEGPKPIDDYNFDAHGFKTTILERKFVSNMTANIGRVRTISMFVVVGNGNGLAGYGLGRGQDLQAAVGQAKKKAARNLEFIERYENRTVLHNLYAKDIKTKIYMLRKQPGHGLVCQRVVKSICDAVGIKDLYAKIEGPTNTQHITKAVFKAFRNQQPYQQIAETHKLHLVESKREHGYKPVVIASPKDGNVRKTMTEDEKRAVDFENMFWDGKVMLKREKKIKFYERFHSYKNKQKHQHRFRNQHKSKMQRVLAGLEKPVHGLNSLSDVKPL